MAWITLSDPNGSWSLKMRGKLLFTAMFCSLLSGQETGAPVTIDGKEILRVYSSVGSFTASDRAPEIAARIIALASKGFTGKVGTRPVPTENATAVVAGPGIVMAVTELDAQTAGIPRDELAQRYAV